MKFVQRTTPNIAPKNGTVSMRAVLGVGPKGADGSNVLPTDTAIANAINNPASSTATALSASIEDRARVLRLPDPSGGDDAAALQAVLDTAGPKTIIGKRGAVYSIGSPLYLNDDTTLDMTDVVIQRRTGTGGNLLRNTGYSAPDRPIGSARNTNIRVIGGVWDKNATGAGTNSTYDLHSIVFHNVDNVEVRDARFRDPGGISSKFSVLFGNVDQFRAINLTFEDTNSDGVHVHGPASNGLISGMFGRTGDDMVSITAAEYVEYQMDPGGGDVSNVVIEKIYPQGSRAGVRVIAGRYDTGGGVFANRVVKGVTIRDVRGWTDYAQAVHVGDGNLNSGTTAGFIDDVVIENIDVTVPDGFYSLNIGNDLAADGALGNITVRNVTVPTAGMRAARVNGTIRQLTFDGIDGQAGHNQRMIDVTATAVVDRLIVRRADVLLDAAKTAGYLVSQQGTVTDLTIEDVRVRDGVAVVLCNGTTTRLNASRWYYTSAYGVSVQGTENPSVHASKVDCTGNFFVFVSGASAGATLRGSHLGMTNAIYRTGTQTVRATGLGVQANITHLTPQQGDVITNSNSGAGPTLPLIYAASSWRPLAGFVAANDAALVGGTVTVANTSVTANSVIRLASKTRGGTPGAVYVSAITPGASFTITSTSATDTSTVQWEILAY